MPTHLHWAKALVGQIMYFTLTPACSCPAATYCACCCVQDGPVWVQIYRVLGVPEPVLDLLQQRQQQSCAELQQVQQLRSRVAELEQQVVQLQGEASGSLPG